MKYGEKSTKGKMIALIVKSVTGAVGASSLMVGMPVLVTLTVLIVGAVTNELINFYNWKK